VNPEAIGRLFTALLLGPALGGRRWASTFRRMGVNDCRGRYFRVTLRDAGTTSDLSNCSSVWNIDFGLVRT
jgi:hypothetical protein